MNQQDYLFRVSVKAIIRNEQGQVLIVEEKGQDWGLPGGGMEHGEDFVTALSRELAEEVGLHEDIDIELVGAIEPSLISRGVWQLRLYFAVTTSQTEFSVGPDALGVKFVSPEFFLQRDKLHDQEIYRLITQTSSLIQ